MPSADRRTKSRPAIPTPKEGSTGVAPRHRKLSRTHRPPELTLEEWQVALRREFAQDQDFRLENLAGRRVFSDFAVSNPRTKQTYRVAIRGEGLGVNYCACADYATNTLGTCKHIEFVLARLREKPAVAKALARGYRPPFSEVYLRYGEQRQVLFAPARPTFFWSATSLTFGKVSLITSTEPSVEASSTTITSKLGYPSLPNDSRQDAITSFPL